MILKWEMFSTKGVTKRRPYQTSEKIDHLAIAKQANSSMNGNGGSAGSKSRLTSASETEDGGGNGFGDDEDDGDSAELALGGGAGPPFRVLKKADVEMKVGGTLKQYSVVIKVLPTDDPGR